MAGAIGRPPQAPAPDREAPLSSYFRRVADRNVPYTLTLEITRRCNLSCQHCFSIEAGGREEMATDELRDAITQARALGTFTVLMTGGEATGHPDFLDLVAHARGLGMLVHFYTNATLVTPQMARRLAELGVAKTGVSLYGATAATHDWLTREPGSFERTVRGAARLHEAGIHTYFKMLLNDRNYHEFPAMRALAERMGLDAKHCINIYERNNLDRAPTDLRAAMDAETHYWSAFWDVHFEELSGADRQTRGQAIGCGIGRSDVTITPYGDVLCCMTIPIPAGNLRERPLREIWEEAPLFRSLRTHREDPVGCTSCQVLSVCARCPGMGFLENRSIYAPSSLSCGMTLRAFRTSPQAATSPRLRGDVAALRA